MGTEFHRPTLSLCQQLLPLQALPGFRCYIRHHSRLVAEGDVTPTALSETYRVRLEYQVSEWPTVWVKSPQLVPREPGQRIPHMYDQSLVCLYMPGSGQWARDMLVAETIVPWTAEWLYYYEMWHATGEWRGGGHEPGDTPFRNNRKEKVTRGRRR